MRAALAFVLASAACTSTTVNILPDGDGGVDATAINAGDAAIGASAIADSGTGADSSRADDAGTSDAIATSDAAPDASDAGPSVDAAADAPASSSPAIDGVDDYSAAETLQTSSAGSGYTARVAWTPTHVFFAMSGDDVGKPAADHKWLLLYLGTGVGGGTVGIDYNSGGAAQSQQPTLPFSALFHVRLKTDLSYVNAQTWGGSSWGDAPGVVPDCIRQGTFVECSIARSALGNPSKLSFVMAIVLEHVGAEWTYAGVPQSAFTDGKDPDYAKYFEFDLGLASTPASYPAKP